MLCKYFQDGRQLVSTSVHPKRRVARSSPISHDKYNRLALA